MVVWKVYHVRLIDTNLLSFGQMEATFVNWKNLFVLVKDKYFLRWVQIRLIERADVTTLEGMIL